MSGMLHPPPPYHIRSMQLSDVERVMSIERRSFPTPWKASAYTYEITQNRLADYQVLTVRLGDQPGQMIGYAGFWMLADEAHVSTIAVSPGWRRRGLGELLFLNLLLMASGKRARLATLEVRTSNSTAQRLYAKYQFEVLGERRNYYKNKENALIMTAEPFNDAYRVFLRHKRDALFRQLRQAAPA